MVILGGEVVCGILGNTALLLRRPSHVETPEQAPVVGAEKVVRHPVRDSGSSFPVPILDFTPLITDHTQSGRVTEKGPQPAPSYGSLIYGHCKYVDSGFSDFCWKSAGHL